MNRMNKRFKKFRKEANKKCDKLQKRLSRKYKDVIKEFYIYFDYNK